MNRVDLQTLTRVWPTIALMATFVDDAVAGPLLALLAAWLGTTWGVPVAVTLFTTIVGVLCATSLIAVRRAGVDLSPRLRAAADRFGKRRFVGPLIRSIGDDRPVITGLVAAVVSPVFTVLFASLLRPEQSLRRTIIVSTGSYGVAFSLAYGGAGTLAGSLL